MNLLLKKDRTRCSTFSSIVLLLSFFRNVPTTATRHGKNSLLETLFGCALGPCVHVEIQVVRTAVTGCPKRRLSVLITSAFPHCAARLAERTVLSVRSRLESCRKAHTVVLRLCRTSRAHWNPAGRFNARPTHKKHQCASKPLV